MPELPEVETIRRQLSPRVAGRTVVEAWGHPSAKFASAPEVVGTTLGEVRRRGKYLLTATDDDRELVLHLGMTGSLDVLPPGRDPTGVSAADPFIRAWWAFDDASALSFRDIRRFGRVAVVPTGEYGSLPTLAALGPEPFSDDFDAAHVYAAARRSKLRIKTQLLNQRMVAGVGNIYADEALWDARINPARRQITRAQAAALRDAVRTALEIGLGNGGTTLRDYRGVGGTEGRNQMHLRCYGRWGEPCERCATELRHKVIDGRTTTFCPTCQR